MNMSFGNFLGMLTEQCIRVKCLFILQCFTVSLRNSVKERTRALAGTQLDSS